MIAALYAALTITLAPISYGPIQFRVSEALTLLPWYRAEAVPGLFVGCLVANFFGGYGLVDMICGSMATLIAALLRDEQAVSIAAQTLQPLLSADGTGSEYLKSLAVDFRCCGNASKAAEELHIHRISLLQRLEKIEALTGLSLKDHRDRLLLQLCVRMIRDE